MITFPPAALCIKLPDIPRAEDICLPGGLCLSHVWSGIDQIPHAADVYLDLFSQIGPAMAPLKPFFDLLDTVLAIFRCVKAVPDAITKLDPTELLRCMPALAEKVDQLLKLIPQLSIPKMVKSILGNLAFMLRHIAADLLYVLSQLQRIADMIDRAADLGDAMMNGFLVCAQATVNGMVMSTGEALRGLGRVILLTNIFMGMIGAPLIPCFGDLISGNIAEGLDVVIELLTALADVLQGIADLIPDPDWALTLALGEQQC